MNADGHVDIVSGSFSGVAYIAYGSERGFRQPVLLPTAGGHPIHLGSYTCPDEGKQFDSAEGPGLRAWSAVPVDWDADGDFDLVQGGLDDGQIHLRINGGTPAVFSFEENSVPVMAAEGVATVGNYAMPVVVDWDGDGLRDLVSGSGDGAVYWFKNVGATEAPRFSKRQMLVRGCDEDDVFDFSRRGYPSQIDVMDWDGDGDLDLLVGDHHQLQDDEGELDSVGTVWLFRRRSDASIDEDGAAPPTACKQ